jgi:hypothetical protein
MHAFGLGKRECINLPSLLVGGGAWQCASREHSQALIESAEEENKHNQ